MTQPNDEWAPPPAAAPKRRLTGGLVALLMLISLLLGLAGGLVLERWLPDRPFGDDEPTESLPTGSGAARGDATWISTVAQASLPATVYLEVRAGGELISGSGFVVRADGYIVTNNHVIAPAAADAGQVTVVFGDGTEEVAEIVGGTPDYDLAVLRVNRTGLEPLVLGDSDTIAVGDPVLAVGAPLGLTGSVTSGIVSAVQRPVTVGDSDPTSATASYINAVQTDAAINRGNSGGPLIATNGEVIGVNTAVARDASSGSGGNEPGFAIPSNQVRHTVEQIIETGQATFPIIGVVLDPDYDGEGVQVLSQSSDGAVPVTPGGPADTAGIAPGDIIVALDGEPVSEPTELIVAVRSRLPGETVVVTVRTASGDRDVQVVLGEQVSQ